MNRTEVIVGGAIAVLAALGTSQLYYDRGALYQPEPKEIAEIDKVPAPPA